MQTLWGDDRHKTTYYDHLRDGSFVNYSDRQSGRQNDGRGRGRHHGHRDGNRDNR